MIPTFDLANSSIAAAGDANAVATAAASLTGGISYSPWDSGAKTTNIALSNGDFTASGNTAGYEQVKSVRNDFNTSTGGKFYWEVSVDALEDAQDIFVGIRPASYTVAQSSPVTGANYTLWRGTGGHYYDGWSYAGGTPTIASGSVLMFAFDVDNGKLFEGVDGVWANSADPAAGTGAVFTGMPAAVDFAFFLSTDNVTGLVTVTLRADPAEHSYSAPSGFTAGMTTP